jgi:hypothetical protein
MTRKCGDCQLCCRLLPMRERDNKPYPEARAMFGYPTTIPDFDKPAGVKCPHQRHHKGCNVYDKRPLGCRIWNCRWLTGDDTAEMSRPDRVHYVIDILPDFIVLEDPESGKSQRIPVVQIWLDPNYPDAINDPGLRAYMERRGQDGMLSLIRLDSLKAMTVFPPSLSHDGKWHAKGNGVPLPQWSTWPEGMRP